jgi:uncharacterized membrane protein YebE (DUF533 family)
MALFKIIAAGAIGYAAYRAWQKHQTNQRLQSATDTGSTTSPHGDPIRTSGMREWDQESTTGAGAQYS